MTPPEAPFAAPWHARLWALTHLLADRGVIDWPGWTRAFGAALAGAPGADHHTLWVATLEAQLAERGLPPAEVEAMTAAWARAHLATPHGAPVRLGHP